VKPNKLWISKIQQWDRHRIVIPIPKGRNGKEVKDDKSQVTPNPSKTTCINP
jgi:hypothetical protein